MSMIDIPPFFPTELETEYNYGLPKCQFCGRDFHPAPKQLYCSDTCANETQKKHKRNYWHKTGKHNRGVERSV